MTRKYPGAKWRPITNNYTNRTRTRTRAVVLHVAASNSDSLQDFFNRPNTNASSHFYVTKSGEVQQYVDADLIAWTSGDGNSTTVGIETEGLGTGTWTKAQYKSIVNLVAWLCKIYDIPAKEMKNSRSTSVGIGTHRLGVNGNFPLVGVQRGRIQRGGGELWSSTTGKACPGNDRQKQWPNLVKDVAKALTPVLPKPGNYVVSSATNGTNPPRLLGYSQPSTQAKVKTRRKVGQKLWIAKFITSGETIWG